MKILGIVLLNLIIYARTFKYEFVSDDRATSRRKPIEYQNWFHKAWTLFTGNRHLNPKHARAITLISHIVCSVLIYIAFGKTNASFIAALLFSINPINNQCSIWIAGRPYAISAALSLLMFCLPQVAPFFYFANKLFSANAIMSPILFLGTEYWYWAFMPLGALVFFYPQLVKKRKLESNKEMNTIYLRKLIPFFKSFGYYLWLCLVPRKIGFYHGMLCGIGINKPFKERCYHLERHAIWGVFSFLGVATAIIINWGTPVAFGLLWFVINIAMWCNLITFHQTIGERYTYLANVGLMYALGSIITSFPYPYNLIVFSVIFTFYTTRLWFIMPIYRNEYWLNRGTVFEHEDAHRVWGNIAFQKFYAKDFVGAYYDLMQARIVTPFEFKTLFNLATVCIILGDMKKAFEFIGEAEKNLYDGKEEQQIEMCKRTREWIAEIQQTKQIDLNKANMVK